MDRVTMMADLSIRRACGFAGLAIGATMAALSFEPVLCFRIGAVLFAVTAAVLWVLGQDAPRRNVRRTELWTLLGGRAPVPEARLQQVLGGVLRERYLWHATGAAVLAVSLWAIAALFLLARQV
jgi:hypothetical protein